MQMSIWLDSANKHLSSTSGHVLYRHMPNLLQYGFISKTNGRARTIVFPFRRRLEKVARCFTVYFWTWFSISAYYKSLRYRKLSKRLHVLFLWWSGTVGFHRIILKIPNFPTYNTWGTFKSPVPRVTHGEHISHLSLTCPMCNTWVTFKSDLNGQWLTSSILLILGNV